MKVLLIYPDVLYHYHAWSGHFYIGLASIAAVIKRDGHQVGLIHITRKLPERRDFLDSVLRHAPDLIGFSTTSHMFPMVREMAGWLADARLKVPVICGGIHPTIAPEEALATRGLDMICRGEGEEAVTELLGRMSHGASVDDIKNIWVRRGDDVIRNPVRPPVSDLDSLPYPDRGIFDYPSLYRERTGAAMFMASRGCPYNCSYCCNHLLRKISPGGKAVRFRSVDNLIQEIHAVTRQYPFINSLVFDDDILFLDRQWSAEFAKRYSLEVGLPFACNARADVTDERTVALMKQAGCRHVKFGVESGNEQISNHILNRHLTNAQIRKAFSLAKQAGLTTESFNMVGVPCDTVATILDTVKLNAQLGSHLIQTSIFQPYCGTKLTEFCQERHLIKGGIGTDFFSHSILELPGATRQQILMLRDYFKVLVVAYRLLGKLPTVLSRPLISLADKLLSLRPTASMMNALYVPLESMRQWVLTLSNRADSARSRPQHALVNSCSTAR